MTDTITLPRATVQQVLKTVEGIHRVDEYPGLQPAVTALRTALEQQAEPVAPKCAAIIEVFDKDWRMEYLSLPVGKHKLYVQQYIYTPPQQQQAEPVSHAVIVGALFDFMGWLTSRKERLVLSIVDDASPAADAIKVFAKMRGLSLDDARVQDWQNYTTSPRRKELSASEILDMMPSTIPAEYDGPLMEFARAVEAKLKGRNT
tara:strand:- start:109 stop:717 length:609 start_codon:yes stop_codon:yes gene_type:complete